MLSSYPMSFRGDDGDAFCDDAVGDGGGDGLSPLSKALTVLERDLPHRHHPDQPMTPSWGIPSTPGFLSACPSRRGMWQVEVEEEVVAVAVEHNLLTSSFGNRSDSEVTASVVSSATFGSRCPVIDPCWKYCQNFCWPLASLEIIETVINMSLK